MIDRCSNYWFSTKIQYSVRLDLEIFYIHASSKKFIRSFYSFHFCMLSSNFLILMKYKSENMIAYICKWSLSTGKQTMTLSGLRFVHCTAYENNSSTTKLLQWKSDIYSLQCKRVQFAQLNYVFIVNLNFKALHWGRKVNFKYQSSGSQNESVSLVIRATTGSRPGYSNSRQSPLNFCQFI